MSWLKDQFSDMSFKGQAKNPLQLIFNPMAAGTVAIAQLKDQDDKTGWFSNLFKRAPKTAVTYDTGGLPAPVENPYQKYYIIIGVVLFIIVLAVLMRPKK